MKKIFLNYSDEADDKKMMQNLCIHLSILKDVDLWHKGRMLAGDAVESTMLSNLQESDAVLHLLSISYCQEEEECMLLLDKGIEQQKENIPVLISSFAWEEIPEIKKLEDRLLPHDHIPIDGHPDNYNAVYTEIVRTVKHDVLGVEGAVKVDQRGYYYLLAGLALAIGIGAAVWVNSEFHQLGITLGIFTLFILTALFSLRKLIFPTGISTFKF